MVLAETTTKKKVLMKESFYLGYSRIDKRKRNSFSKGRNQAAKRFKRYVKPAKYIKDNPENQVAREKERDAYHFTDSEEDFDDLGMGLELSDLPNLDAIPADKHIALTQDNVRPFYTSEESFDDSKLQEALAELKYKTFRPNQEETIKRILFGRSTLFISPTGSGKSLCYQIPALLYWRYRKYITIVVSPLIALMEDQMSNFPDALNAVSFHSGHNRAHRIRAIDKLCNGEAQVAFISPEAIVSGVLELDDLRNLPPVGFVCIDEAHCLSEWSHNFRPAYLQFYRILNQQMCIKTYLGLTATASRATSFAIAKSLTINPDTDVIGQTVVPENLLLSVSHGVNKDEGLIKLLKSKTFRILPSIIVYCNRREDTERVASTIRTQMKSCVSLVEVPERTKKTEAHNDPNTSTGEDSTKKDTMELSWHAEAFHAGMTYETRKKIQRQFVKGELRVVVATIAFGMGINKSNVRAIIHYDMPSSFESYMQEIGRAGRDGKPAQCHMILNSFKSDLYYHQRNIYSAITEVGNLKKLVETLFKPCRCGQFPEDEERAKLERLNQMDPHEISSLSETKFFNTPKESKPGEEDDDDDDLNGVRKVANFIGDGGANYVHKSKVKKHRSCEGHEVMFSIEKMEADTNLKIESIITLIYQLQQNYPQFKIKHFPPAKLICEMKFCKGPKQVEKLKNTCKPVATGLIYHNIRERESNEENRRTQLPCEIKFDITKVANALTMSTADLIKALKKVEWELDDKTGRFRKSLVKVRFTEPAYHMQMVGDLTAEELEEVSEFLIDYTKSYEMNERKKMFNVFATFRSHSLDVHDMTDKQLRLETSGSLKSALNSYFSFSSSSQTTTCLVRRKDDATRGKSFSDEDLSTKLTPAKEAEIRKAASAFIMAHKKNIPPRAIARIFQGISTPNFPADIWGLNKRWWRIHLDVDFLVLTKLILEEYQKA